MFNFEFPKIDFINTLESFELKIKASLKDITELKEFCEGLEVFKRNGISYIKFNPTNIEKEMLSKLPKALTNFE